MEKSQHSKASNFLEKTMIQLQSQITKSMNKIKHFDSLTICFEGKNKINNQSIKENILKHTSFERLNGQSSPQNICLEKLKIYLKFRNQIEFFQNFLIKHEFPNLVSSTIASLLNNLQTYLFDDLEINAIQNLFWKQLYQTNSQSISLKVSAKKYVNFPILKILTGVNFINLCYLSINFAMTGNKSLQSLSWINSPNLVLISLKNMRFVTGLKSIVKMNRQNLKLIEYESTEKRLSGVLFPLGDLEFVSRIRFKNDLRSYNLEKVDLYQSKIDSKINKKIENVVSSFPISKNGLKQYYYQVGCNLSVIFKLEITDNRTNKFSPYEQQQQTQRIANIVNPWQQLWRRQQLKKSFSILLNQKVIDCMKRKHENQIIEFAQIIQIYQNMQGFHQNEQ